MLRIIIGAYFAVGIICIGVFMLGVFEKQEHDAITDPEERMFQEGLLDVIDGIEVFINRYVAKLEKTEEEFSPNQLEEASQISILPSSTP